jgi:geranylgeranyl pyrophosphate synthase/predicted secreted hydrolase
MFHNFTDRSAALVEPSRKQLLQQPAAPRQRTGWPGPGPIDLAVHDRPHSSANLEWWYVNSHLRVAGGAEFSLFAAFFRVRSGKDGATGQDWFTHYLTWALTDVQTKKYHGTVLLDPAAPQLVLRNLDEERGDEDPRLCRALREVFARGQAPLPDQVLRRPALVALDRLSLDLDGNRLERRRDGSYALDLWDDWLRAGCRLTFTPVKPAVRHGKDGYSMRSGGGREMFYYFIPRCTLAGTVSVDGQTFEVESGSAWYDHEFGSEGEVCDRPLNSQFSWNWLSAQLDDGTDLSVFEIVETNHPEVERHVILVGPQGARQVFKEASLEPLSTWRSCRTFQDYPDRWRLRVPDAQIDLTVEAEFPAQELVTTLSPPAFWEGRVKVQGLAAGRPVRGLGYIERTGFRQRKSFEDLLSAAGGETRRLLQALLPVGPTHSSEQGRRLIASDERAYYLDGVDLDVYARAVVRPIREVVDRAGKAWRSFGALACVDLVGGDTEKFRHYLAAPELLHVGSLIIDDVEDRSDVRRGGPACHKVHGEALAINAGSTCYFFAQLPFLQDNQPAAKMVRFYEAYFEGMRAAHAGQALDIVGLEALMPEVVESGDAALLERRLFAIHRLKSAVPPGTLARSMALLADGSEEQARCLGELFEAFGLAFQIIDDVLNLRGFANGLKTRGEDVTQGKVTAPLVKAMGRLPREQRRSLWATVASRPSDARTIAGVVETLDACGALDACERQARALVEAAWLPVGSLFPDSYAKVNLRAFSWFLLERHY